LRARALFLLAPLLLLSILAALLAGDAFSDPQNNENTEVTGVETGDRSAHLHPHFTLTLAELRHNLQDMPEETRSAVEENPVGFLELVSACLLSSPELLWLVDKEHSVSETYEAPDLVLLDDYAEPFLKTTRPAFRLREVVMADLLSMLRMAHEKGMNPVIGSAYRSLETQRSIYESQVRLHGSVQADRQSARAGYSQHQLGTTIDFSPIDDSFGDTREAPWLAANSWRFGFSLSYPLGYEELTGYKYEPWHFRYIGRPAAMLTESFFSGIQQRFLEYWLSSRDFFHSRWRL
jgi:D-alanyl-D-alanine carboxypeptidase